MLRENFSKEYNYYCDAWCVGRSCSTLSASLLISLTYTLYYVVPTHFSLYVFQPSWARNTARDIWTLWGNGIRASIVRIPTRATTSSVAEPKYTSIAAPKKTKSFSQKYKSKYPNPLQCIVFPTSVEQPHTSKVTSSTQYYYYQKFRVFLQFDSIHWDCRGCGGGPVNYHLGLVFLLFMLLSVQETSSIFQ